MAVARVDGAKRVLKLAPFPFLVVLVIGKEEWEDECRRCDYTDRSWLPDDTDGEVSTHPGYCIVKLGNADARTVIHECVHAWQALCNHICEQEPGAEIEAYYIAHITEWVLGEIQCSMLASSTSQLSSSPSPQPLPTSIG